MEMKKFLKLALFCIIGGMMDILFEKVFSNRLHLPLFFDTTFCVALTFYGGILCGLATAAFFQLGHFLFWTPGVSYVFLLYFFCSASIALTVWLYKKYVMDRHNASIPLLFAELLVLSIIACIVASVTGGIISRICAEIVGTENEFSSPVDFMILMFRAHISSPLAAAIISRIPINIIDRVITVFAGWGIYLLLKKTDGWDKARKSAVRR